MTHSTAELVERVEWRCFHCGDLFTDESCARDHFGPDEGSKPACQIKAGAEGSLVKAIREVERQLEEAWAAIHEESTEAAKAYYNQQTRHYAQLQAAEEAGYERGLVDARTEAADRLQQQDRLREALEEIRKPGFGAAADWSVEECEKYWSRLALKYRRIADRALTQSDNSNQGTSK
jgi:hypothetical protein